MKEPVGNSQLLETTGEEEMAPGSRVEDIIQPTGSCQAHRLLTSSSRTFTGTSLCKLFDCPRSRDPPS